MITSKNFVSNGPRRSRHKCPECGHVGKPAEFVEQLPGVTLAINGSDRHYEVQIPGEEATRRLASRPTEEEIIAMMEEAGKKEKKPRGSGSRDK